MGDGRAVETSAPTGQPRICRGDHWSPAVPHMFVRDAFFGRPHRAAPTEFPPYVGETPVIRESVRDVCGVGRPVQTYNDTPWDGRRNASPTLSQTERVA